VKVRIGMDVSSWSKPGGMYFFDADSPSVSSKFPHDTTRYIVEVEIPDPIKPDVVMTGEAKEAAHEETH